MPTQFFEHAPFGMALLDEAGHIIAANDRLATTLGVPPDSLTACPLSDFWSVNGANLGSPAVHDGHYRTNTGEKRAARLATWPVSSTSAHRAIALMEVNHGTAQADIDEILAKQLRRVSSVFAHQVRNPIAGVSGALTILRDRQAASGDSRAIIDEVLERLQQLNDGVGDLVDFGRPIAPKPTSTSILELLHACLKRLPADANDIEIELPSNDIELRADPMLLRRCLCHVLNNAVEAIEGAGRIVVRAERQNGTCTIEVEDSGSGCRSEAPEALFEAFFTTKTQRMGLGLALAHRIIQAQGGHIEANHNASSGLTITLRIPTG